MVVGQTAVMGNRALAEVVVVEQTAAKGGGRTNGRYGQTLKGPKSWWLEGRPS